MPTDQAIERERQQYKNDLKEEKKKLANLIRQKEKLARTNYTDEQMMDITQQIEEAEREVEQLEGDIKDLGRSFATPQERLIADLIVAEDAGDDVEVAIIRAKLKQSSASNVSGHQSLAIGRSSVKAGRLRSDEIRAEIRSLEAEIKDLQKELSRVLVEEKQELRIREGDL